MTRIIWILLLFYASSCNGQVKTTILNNDNFENRILSYFPINSGITDDKYRNALKLLEQTTERIKKNKNSFDRADYWNILVILNELKEPDSIIKIAFDKFHKAKGSCEYLTSFQKVFKSFSPSIETRLTEAANQCLSGDKPNLDLKNYITTNNLDESLVILINQVENNDQVFRTDETKQSQQKILDFANQKIIDSLFLMHKKYIGKTFVGEKFENVMWQVIQHSDIVFMEKYLPIIQKAVDTKEIKQGTLKYLIDRISSERLGVQYFGSQANVPMAEKKAIAATKKKYKID